MGKMLEILQAYTVLEKIASTARQLYRNTEVWVCPPYGNTNFFKDLARVLLGETFSFIIALDYVIQTATDHNIILVSHCMNAELEGILQLL